MADRWTVAVLGVVAIIALALITGMVQITGNQPNAQGVTTDGEFKSHGVVHDQMKRVFQKNNDFRIIEPDKNAKTGENDVIEQGHYQRNETAGANLDGVRRTATLTFTTSGPMGSVKISLDPQVEGTHYEGKVEIVDATVYDYDASRDQDGLVEIKKMDVKGDDYMEAETVLKKMYSFTNPNTANTLPEGTYAVVVQYRFFDVNAPETVASIDPLNFWTVEAKYAGDTNIIDQIPVRMVTE